MLDRNTVPPSTTVLLIPSWSATARQRRTPTWVMSASVASLSEKRIILDASDCWVAVRASPRSWATLSTVTRMSTLIALWVCWERGRQEK